MGRMNHEPGVLQLIEGETGIHIQALAASEFTHRPTNRVVVITYTSRPDVNAGHYTGKLKSSPI